jgi:DNA-binding CsgD family transcriptional regulator/tetratricopeptide (TPR) repeat protein
VSAPVAPFRVPDPGMPIGGGQVSPVLIGRDDLLALADRRLASAADGRGELLFFAGEAGIGKTRLLREVAKRAADAGFAVLGTGASPGDAEVAAGMLQELSVELRRNEHTAGAGQRIADRIREAGDGDPDRHRRLLVTDVTEVFETVANCPWPMMVMLEDLHWADDLTLEVLGRLSRRAQSLPILLVGTYRSDELYPRVPMRVWRTRLLTQRHAEEVRLGRLSRDDTTAMATAIASTVLSTTVTGAVFDRSDGIPLHIEEFLAASGGASVPDTLADAVLGRAEQLSDAARALAGSASVLGRRFDLDLLTAITGDTPEIIDVGLRELTERFFVQPHQDRSTYDFRHALIRDALYADLTPHRRRDLHARAAEAAVLAGFADAFVSDQYERANLPATAHRYALTAATEATGMSAHREAVELYRRAERTMPPDTPDTVRADLLAGLASALAAIDHNAAAAQAYESAYQVRLDLGDTVGAAAVMPLLVQVRHLLGADLDERTASLRAALRLIAFRADGEAQEVRAHIHAELSAAYMLDRRLAEAMEDGELAQSIAVEDCDRAMRCNLDATLGSVLLFSGRMDEGWRLLEGSIARAEEERFESQAARGYRMLGTSASMLVEYDIAERWLREGIAYAERVERFNDRHYMAAHLAHVLWATGDWDGANREAQLALADGRGGITTRVTALHVLGFLAMGRRDFRTATAALGEAAELGEGMRELQRISPAWWGLAETALRQGDHRAAVDWCEKGFAASARVRDAAYLFPYVVTGTRAYLTISDTMAARDWLARTSEPLVERGIPGTLAAVDHGWGLVHLHEGQTGKARDALASAAAAWASRRRFLEGTEVLLDQARCATRSRRPADAAVFSAQAHALLSSAGAPPPAPPPSRSPTSLLSAREVEVARLVATGATNREIAAALTIAPKTAAAHVEHILTKLGVSRRAQIATWAATQVEPSR